MTSLEEITILSRNELEGVEGVGTAPESSKVELEAKVWAKSSALEEGKTAVVPSEDTRGGKEEEAKLELTFFAKCQKGSEEVEPERLLHFKRRKQFLVLRRKILHDSGMKYKLHEFLEFEDDGNPWRQHPCGG